MALEEGFLLSKLLTNIKTSGKMNYILPTDAHMNNGTHKYNSKKYGTKHIIMTNKIASCSTALLMSKMKLSYLDTKKGKYRKLSIYVPEPGMASLRAQISIHLIIFEYQN